MIQFNPHLLNRNVAPEIADFTAAEIPDLRSDFSQSTHWLSNHFLNTLLGPSYSGAFRQYAINMLFRAQAQFDLYHRARDQTAVYLQKSTHHNPAVRHYYAAISLWESCLLNYQIFIDLYTKAVAKMAFAPKDGSEEQRAYDLANDVKHWGGAIHSSRCDEGHNIPLWLTNGGLCSLSNRLSFGELAAITREVALAADALENPGSAARSNKSRWSGRVKDKVPNPYSRARGAQFGR